ncbi:endonuclease/exonuclease/phosphatase family protein [Salinisphaera sp. T31B1]|uniref:endonuclease/exonuclease/phosphatase family protein n=1 Tax=Salinisphaera sp. T31B1 TaxID=727963 RepID=UPI00334018BD
MKILRIAAFALVATAGIGLSIASVLPLVPSYIWWIRITDFPRLQSALLLVVLIALAACFVRRYRYASLSLMAVMLATLIYHAVILLPYAPLHGRLEDTDCAPDQRLSVMVANVRLSNDPDGRLIQQVRRYAPDVLVVLEANDQWLDALSPLEQAMPHTITHTTGSYFGIALYSRLPLHSSAVRHLAGQNTPQIVTEVELRTGEQIDFLGIHPRPPHPSQSALGRDGVLLKAGLLLRDSDRPGVIAGDLNATPWERAVTEMRKIARLVDPRRGYGYLPTYDAQSAWMRWPLDHVFYEAGFDVTELIRGDNFGSDHFPYVARLCRVDRSNSETVEATDADTLRDARQTIERARAQSEQKSGG